MKTSEAFWQFLPAGLNELFEMVRFEKTDQSYDIWLDEKKKLSDEDYRNPNIVARGYTDYVTIQDYPMRGRPVYLHMCARGLRSWNRCYCSRFRWANPFPLGSSVLRCSVSHEGCKPYCLSVFPMSALPKPRILLPLLFPYPFCFWFFVFNADSRAEGVEFQTILSASRLSDIFFNASFCRIGRFRFGCLKR